MALEPEVVAQALATPPETPKNTTPPSNPKRDIVAEIVRKRQEQAAREMEPGVEEAPVAPTAPVVEAPIAAAPETPPEPVAAPVEPSKPDPTAEAIARAERAAQLAEQRTRELDDMIRRLSMQAQPIQPVPPKVEEPPPVDVTKLGEAAAAAIYSGDQVRAAAALKEVLDLAMAPKPQVDVEQLKNGIKAEVRAEQQFQGDLNTFGSEFKDIVDDPHLTHLAALHTDSVRREKLAAIGVQPDQLRGMNHMQVAQLYQDGVQQNRLPPQMEVFREAGTRVRNWEKTVVDNALKKQTTPVIDLSAKRLQKDDIAPPPKPANASAVLGQDDQPSPTTADIVRGYRKARGQAV